jgi:hypothetical protein
MIYEDLSDELIRSATSVMFIGPQRPGWSEQILEICDTPFPCPSIEDLPDPINIEIPVDSSNEFELDYWEWRVFNAYGWYDDGSVFLPRSQRDPR